MLLEWCSWEIEPGVCPDCAAKLWIVWAQGEFGERRSRWCPACKPDLGSLGLEVAVACGPGDDEYKVWHESSSIGLEHVERLAYWVSCLRQLPAERRRRRLRVVQVVSA